jgi:RecA-family ATPase
LEISAYQFVEKLKTAGLPEQHVKLVWNELVTMQEENQAGVTLDFHTLADLALMPNRMTWLIKGWWPHPSYGQKAGPEKSLKSWLDIIENVAITSGKSLFGQFDIVTPGPVIVFTGEGSAGLYWRRVKHVGRAFGLTDAEIARLPIQVCSQRALLTSQIFQRTLKAKLDEVKPVKVSLDPLYSYHGGDTEAGNVHATAEVLNAFSDPLVETETSGVIVNHFRKDHGGTLKLADITQSGGREWVDSWTLMKQREKPDLAANEFKLRVSLGSRQWGGAAYDLDISLGAFDLDAFEYTSDMTWDIRDAAETDHEKETTLTADFMLLAKFGQPMTKKDFAANVGVAEKQAGRRLDDLVDAGRAARITGKPLRWEPIYLDAPRERSSVMTPKG